MLHARELDLPGPGRARLRLKADPPPPFKEGLRWLGLYDPSCRAPAWTSGRSRHGSPWWNHADYNSPVIMRKWPAGAEGRRKSGNSARAGAAQGGSRPTQGGQGRRGVSHRVRRRLPADALATRSFAVQMEAARGDHEAASQCPARTRQVAVPAWIMGGGRRRSGNATIEQIAEHGGSAGVRDPGLLDSALARAPILATYGEDVDAAAFAAAYAFGVARNHPFVDGNKRTALVVLELFLELHGHRLSADDAGCVGTMIVVGGRVVRRGGLGGVGSARIWKEPEGPQRIRAAPNARPRGPGGRSRATTANEPEAALAGGNRCSSTGARHACPIPNATDRLRLRRHARRQPGRRSSPAPRRRSAPKGCAPPSAEAIRRIVGLSLVEAMVELMAEPDPAVGAAAGRALQGGLPRAPGRPEFHEPLFPGTRELLDALLDARLRARRGHRQGDAGPALRARASRPGAPLRHPADGRPAPEQAASRDARRPPWPRPGSRPAATMLIGDTTFDILMARAAECTCRSASAGATTPAHELTAAGAVRVLDRFDELHALLPDRPRSGRSDGG